MSNVWTVSSGSYSDYRIVGIFSTEAKATKFYETRKLVDDEIGSVSWEELDPAPPTVVQTITVQMFSDGTTYDLNPKWEEVPYLGFRGFGSYFYYANLSPNRDFPTYAGQLVLVWTVEVTDPIHAVKVVNEKRAQILAAGLWGQDRAYINSQEG